MGIASKKITTYADNIKDLPDVPTISASELKAKFDSRTDNEVKTLHNGLIDDLLSTADGNSGADNIGATAISGVSGATTQAILEGLKSLIDAVTLGQIPDGTLTNAKLASDIKIGSLAASNSTDKSAVIAITNEIIANLAAEITNRQNADNLKLNLTGGTLSGNVDIHKDNPTLNFTNTTRSNRSGRANLDNNDNLCLYNLDSAQQNGTMLAMFSEATALANKMQLYHFVSGSITPYKIYGEHNPEIITGSYTGDGTTSRTIALGVTPKKITISPRTINACFEKSGLRSICYGNSAITSNTSYPISGTGFLVSTNDYASATAYSSNVSGSVYDYVAEL